MGRALRRGLDSRVPGAARLESSPGEAAARGSPGRADVLAPVVRLFAGSPVRYWLLAFLAINLALPQDGGGNPRVRFAAMASFLETGSFRIDKTLQAQRRWSWDWSRAPDGHFYANKAPGTILLGLPFYWVVDQYVLGNVEGLEKRLDRRLDREAVYNAVLCLFLQLIPFAAAVALAAAWMARRGCSPASIHLLAVAALFGSTASIFMNTYFGHALTAALLIGAVLALLERRLTLFGLAVGGAVLCEYAAVFPAVALLAAALLRERASPRKWFSIAAGAALPAAAWGVYHTVCFGSPFRTALQYLNPMFVTDPTIAGVPIARGPHLEILVELLFGPSRGLLFTQPWILAALVALPVLALRRGARSSQATVVALVACGGLCGLLFMCTRHPHGWHSGWSSGPRYFSAALPLFALAVALHHDRLSDGARRALWGLLLLSVALTGLALSTTILSPTFEPLWSHLAGKLAAPADWGARVRFVAFSAILGAAAWLTRKGSSRGAAA